MAKANGNGKSPNYQVLKHSVTAGDYAESPYSGYGSVWHMLFPGIVGQIGDLPPYWSPMRDRVLRTTPMREAMWSAAVHIAVTQIATADWRLDGRRLAGWQELLLAADNNQTFVAFEEKQAKDYLLTDNGNFFEIIRATDARGSRIIGLSHLSSWRCQRTGDPDIPVLYRDRKGEWHEMRDYQVVGMEDEPDADLLYYNVGFCAASRAFPAIMKLSALETYVYEKISGKRPLDIALVNAQIKEQQLQDAVDTQKERSLEQGYVQYMGVVMIPILDPSATPQVAHIPIAGLPDGFDPKEERLTAQLVYADCLGLDPTTLNPELAARGRALGSGAQAQVLDDKEKGKATISYRKKHSALLNDRVLPNRVTFSFYERDLADELRRAQVIKENTAAMRDLVGNGTAPPIIPPELAARFLVDNDVLSEELMPGQQGTTQTLRDTQKPKVAEDTATIEGFGQEKSRRGLELREKEYDELVNTAEQWAIDKELKNYELMADDELVSVYLRANPVKEKAKAEKPVKETALALVEETRKDAQRIYKQLGEGKLPTPVTKEAKEEVQPIVPVQIVLPNNAELANTLKEANALSQIDQQALVRALEDIALTNQETREKEMCEMGAFQQRVMAMLQKLSQQKAPQVTVNVPKQEAPVVNVAAPKVEVKPAQVTVNVPERKPIHRTVERDADGHISGIQEE